MLRDCLPIPPAWALDKSWRLRNNGEYYVHARQEGALPRSFYAVASKDSWALDKSWRQHNKGGYYIHARQEGAFPRSFNAVEDKGGWILTEEKDGERFYVLGTEKGAPFRTLQEAYAHLKVMLEQWILTEEKGGKRFYVLRNKKIDSFNTLEEAYAHLKVMLEQWLLFDRPIWLGSVLKEPSIE